MLKWTEETKPSGIVSVTFWNFPNFFCEKDVEVN